MKDEMKVLEMVAETEILGKKIKMYGSVEEPYFVATDVAEWLDERDGYTVARKVDDEDKDTQIVCTLGGMQKTTVFTEDGLYDACMLSRKKIAKPLKKEIKMYLKAIRKTGAAIQPGREEEMVQKYFPSFSPETQADMVNDLLTQNKKLREENSELREVYDDLMDTSDYMQMNTVAKELGIGHHKLMEFLRDHGVFFYNNDMTNIPYERFRNEGKFVVKETRCRDGAFRSVTYATRKGLDYVGKLLKKNGYDISAAVTE